MIIIDTDILIWILRGKIEFRDQLKKTIFETDGHVYITPIQAAEIYAGLKISEMEMVSEFINSILCLNIDKKIGILAGRFIQQYSKSNNVTLADAIIAATAKTWNYKLWTLNRKHYPMFKNNDFYNFS